MDGHTIGHVLGDPCPKLPPAAQASDTEPNVMLGKHLRHTDVAVNGRTLEALTLGSEDDDFEHML